MVSCALQPSSTNACHKPYTSFAVVDSFGSTVAAGAAAVGLMHAVHLVLQCLSCMQLEEKRIPYIIEKINMRCYGDKPPSFLAKVDARSGIGLIKGCGANNIIGANNIMQHSSNHHQLLAVLLEVSWWDTVMSSLGSASAVVVGCTSLCAAVPESYLIVLQQHQHISCFSTHAVHLPCTMCMAF